MDWQLTGQGRLMDPYKGGRLISGATPGDHSNQETYITGVVDECIPDDCWTLSIIPEGFYPYSCSPVPGGIWSFDATYDSVPVPSPGVGGNMNCVTNLDFGECASDQPIECDEGSGRVRIEISFNMERPWETAWELREQETNVVVVSGDYSSNYMVKGATLYDEVCKPVADCYYFTMLDPSGVSGFRIFLDEEEVSGSSTVPIGSSCQY